MSSTTII